MNLIKEYILFNPEFKNHNLSYIKNKYYEDINNNKVVSINTFFKIYDDFDIDFYKKFNKEVENLSKIDTIVHFHNIGFKNNYIYSLNSFYKKYPDYKEKYLYNNKNEMLDLLYSYVNYLKDQEFKNFEEDENLEYFEDFEDDKNYQNNIAHIFVHFFEIGGGECYLQEFNKYNDVFNETLFINKNYKNKTLFKFNGNIIYYEDYHDLNNKLKDYDIIIDHQLYWFEFKDSFDAFKNIDKNKIFRITHGVPIHFKNINSLNYYYSIELYNEKYSDKSWNNHIKIYNNIGVNKKYKKCNFNENIINIAIVGRINSEKIPEKFITLLLNFINKYKKYFFNFYGIIDENYEKYFIQYTKNNANIKYHGIIEPKCIENIYLNNDILMHPSKSEAGATVVLEAMSYGLPIICKNVYGLINALNNTNNFLCNDDSIMFEKLLLINKNNYKDFYNKNILKILNENNIYKNTKNLINSIIKINNYENQNNIPNIIHYIFGLEKQKEEFSFVYYISILSNYIINKPSIIYFHYQYEPYGYWWSKAKKYLFLNYINCDFMTWGRKKIIKYAHKADKIRLDMLYKYGGVYMDIDTITYKSYKHLLNYDFVIGIQDEDYGSEKITLYCNAILLSKKNNIFIKKWIDNYEEHFVTNGWCEASIHYPHKIFESLNNNEKNNIKILNKNCFYYPCYYEVDKIFEKDINIPKDLITLHLWNSFSKKYFKNIHNFNYIFNENSKSLYSYLLKNIYDKIYHLKNNITNYNLNQYNYQNNNINIYNISIIIIFENKFIDKYKNILNSLIYQDALYLLNIEIVIIDNNNENSNDFFNYYEKDEDLKQNINNKNINIKIIKLNDTKINEGTMYNIGINCCSNELVTFIDHKNICAQNRLILQAIKISELNNSKILYNKTFTDEILINITCKKSLVDIISNNNLNYNINNIIFNKNLINIYFPNNYENIEEMTLLFIILNILNSNYIECDNNIINNNLENKKNNNNFQYLINKLSSDNLILHKINNEYYNKMIIEIINKNYYNNNNYLEYIVSIYNI